MSETDTSQYGFGRYGDWKYGTAYVTPSEQSRETTIVNKSLIPLPPPVFTGMKLESDIALGDLVLNRIDENNVIWVCTDIEGWWVQPEPEIPDYGKGWGDGSYDAAGRWQARQITLSGVFLPPDPQFVPQARNTLVEATSLVRSGAWLRTSENPTKASYVRISGQPSIQTVSPRGRTEFEIGLRAADPIKYSWNEDDELGEGYTLVTLTDKTSVTITNDGNIAVGCLFKVVGPLDSPATIRNVTTEQTMNVLESQTASETLEIDTYERSVALNGTFTGARSRIDVVPNWIRLDPGPNIIAFADLGTSPTAATLKVYYRSGWIA